jgi:hypothetical protein
MRSGHSFSPLPLGWLLLVLFALPACALFSAPRSVLWERWAGHDETSSATIDHEAWSRFLSSYVEEFPDGINRVRYADVASADRDALDGYIDILTAVPISKYNRAEQRAYWINLYNALTVKIVLDHYPVASIRDIDISPGLFSIGPWDKKLITVEGEDLSLNDIEHRVLRPIWKDPRIHYAVNCASIGCPNLMPLAFTSENSEILLEKGARDYINHPRGVEIVDGEPVASKIYDWFRPDFGDSDQAVLSHLRRFAEPALSKELKTFDRIGGYRYDWALNGVAKE